MIRLLVPLLTMVLLSRSALAQTSVPVIVELFSSEGCSSCPSADAVLRTLEVPGIEVIPLEWHVDYWNDLGWADPFSSPAATGRQHWYAGVLRTRGMYTPQMVVAGSREFVGSDRERAETAVREAAARRRVPVTLTTAGAGHVRVTGDLGNAGATLHVVITEAGLETAVPAGENAGRTLAHAPVVRWSAADQAVHGAFAVTVDVPSHPSWHRDRLSIVAWVQDADGSIRGAVRLPAGP
jgi:hypothetical protein